MRRLFRRKKKYKFSKGDTVMRIFLDEETKNKPGVIEGKFFVTGLPSKEADSYTMCNIVVHHPMVKGAHVIADRGDNMYYTPMLLIEAVRRPILEYKETQKRREYEKMMNERFRRLHRGFRGGFNEEVGFLPG